MVYGIILGFIFGLIPIVIGYLFDIALENGIKGVLIGSVVSIIVVVAGGLVGVKADQIQYEKDVNTYKISKQTIEAAMNNDKMSDLEKIELVKQITSLNTKLEELKVDVKQWHVFYLDENKVNELEPIKIKVGE